MMKFTDTPIDWKYISKEILSKYSTKLPFHYLSKEVEPLEKIIELSQRRKKLSDMQRWQKKFELKVREMKPRRTKDKIY